MSIPPFKKKSRGKTIAFVLVAVLLVGGGGFVYQTQIRAAKTERVAQTTAEPPPPVTTAAPAPEPPPPPTAALEPPASASASAKKPDASAGAGAAAVPTDPDKICVVDTAPMSPGKNIVLDGRVIGKTPRKVNVRCGTHRIQIGEQLPETLQFPCGGEITFTE